MIVPCTDTLTLSEATTTNYKQLIKTNWLLLITMTKGGLCQMGLTLVPMDIIEFKCEYIIII